MNDILPNFFILAGFIIGLGAVTVIDLHGFFAQKSIYWTVATTRTHKITKPLIWLGLFLILTGLLLAFLFEANSVYLTYIGYLFIPMVLNGLFLSFYVSPVLLKREKSNQDNTLLSKSLQSKIFISFIFSFLSWWMCVLLFTLHISL